MDRKVNLSGFDIVFKYTSKDNYLCKNDCMRHLGFMQLVLKQTRQKDFHILICDLYLKTWS